MRARDCSDLGLQYSESYASILSLCRQTVWPAFSLLVISPSDKCFQTLNLGILTRESIYVGKRPLTDFLPRPDLHSLLFTVVDEPYWAVHSSLLFQVLILEGL